MNWYKECSKNIELDKELESDALAVSNDIIDSWNEFFSSNEFSMDYNLHYYSKYTEQKEQIIISFLREGVQKHLIANLDESTGIVLCYPSHLVYNGIVSDFNDPMIAHILASYIIHEITHNVDPKLHLPSFRQVQENISKKQRMGDTLPYYTSAHEFDAYSKQLSYDIKSITKNNQEKLNQILKWLRNDNFYYILTIVDRKIYEPFLMAVSNFPDKIKTLKQRILNELQT